VKQLWGRESNQINSNDFVVAGFALLVGGPSSHNESYSTGSDLIKQPPTEVYYRTLPRALVLQVSPTRTRLRPNFPPLSLFVPSTLPPNSKNTAGAPSIPTRTRPRRPSRTPPPLRPLSVAERT
jgi:hypothetical protein